MFAHAVTAVCNLALRETDAGCRWRLYRLLRRLTLGHNRSVESLLRSLSTALHVDSAELPLQHDDGTVNDALLARNSAAAAELIRSSVSTHASTLWRDAMAAVTLGNPIKLRQHAVAFLGVLVRVRERTK